MTPEAEAALVRHDAYCGAVGCDRPSAAGICPMHRDMYRDFGITEHMLLQEPAAMPTTEAQPTPPAAPKEEATKEHDYCRPGCGHDGEPTAPGPTVAELEAELERERERARADAAERDAVEERERADEALSQLHDARVAMKQVRAALFSALGVEPDDTSTLRLLAANHGYIRTLDSDYGKAVKEIGDAVHLFQLLGVKIGTLPDMITALLPRPRLLKLRIRNETAAALAIDNLSLQEVPEDDPRMVEAIRLHREATALRRAAEPDRATDAEKVQE